MKTLAMLLVLAAPLAGRVATAPPAPTPPVQADDLVRARLGQTVSVGGPKVTPLRVVEDSRCPDKVVCVWAGRIRVSVRIDLGHGSQVGEMEHGRPIQIADGTLELVEVRPGRSVSTGPAKPVDQSFGFRFMGGL
jgi:hypothetical protein